MKNEKILNVIGQVNDEYIEEAAQKEKVSPKRTWVKWSLLAACLLLTFSAGVRFLPAIISELKISIEARNLPMLTISSESGGMGYEACLAYDISELANGNPWTVNSKLNTLPVYKNTPYSSSGIATAGIGKERMLELAEQAANALGMKITDIKYDVNEKSGYKSDASLDDNDVIWYVNAETATAKIAVTRSGMVTINFMNFMINFTEGLELPAEYSFNYDEDTSDEEAKSVTDYLLERYAAFVSFDQPQKALFADYNIYGSRHRSYYAYDAAGSLTEQILNYNFNKVQFAPNDNGDLMLIRKSNDLTLAEKIGDYPIIASEEAAELLLNGNYFTSVPEKMPGEEYIVKTELVYRAPQEGFAGTSLPCYRFWVELTDKQQENGLKTYGAYYVPAVKQKYLNPIAPEVMK